MATITGRPWRIIACEFRLVVKKKYNACIKSIGNHAKNNIWIRKTV